MEQILQAMIPFMAVLVGAAIAYGALRNQVKTITKELAELQKGWSKLVGNPGGNPAYIKRSECNEKTEAISEKIGHLVKKIDSQGGNIKSFQNFARYMLTKEGLTIVEVEEILNGD